MRTPVVSTGAYYLGIDPGLSGVLAVIYDVHGRRPEISVYKAPIIMVPKKKKGYRTEYDVHAFGKLLTPFRNCVSVAGLELLSGYPALSSQALFAMGRGMGLWEMALAANCIPYTLILPQKWKKEMGVLVPEKDDKKRKAAAVLRAKQLFPWLDFPLVKDHNKADAVLIADYMRRMNPQ